MIPVPNISYGYFLVKDEVNNFLQAGYKVNGNRSENTFALYDDINSTASGKKKIIFPKSKFFVPVDLISVAFPLPVVFYNYSSTENAIADLIYANLKLKKLIDEYKNIQERSQQLSWDSQYLFKQQDDTMDSIYRVAARYEKSFKQTMDESRLVLDYQACTRLSGQTHFFKTPSFITPNNENHTWTAPNQNQAQATPNYDEGKNTTSGNNTDNSYRGTSDPFIVKVFIGLANIIPYLISHKGEAVFYGIGLTFIFLFFSSIFRR